MNYRKDFFPILMNLILIGGSYSSCSTNANEHNNRLPIGSEKCLDKKEIKAIVDIVAQETILEREKDSLANFIFVRTHNPLKFDEIQKNSNKTTISEWQAYNGDKKMWELANLDFYLYEFGLIGTIDGFGGVLTTLESSKHGKSMDLHSISYGREDFELPMSKINKKLKTSERMIVTVDLSVFIIRIKDFEKFKSLIGKTNYGKVITYSKI